MALALEGASFVLENFDRDRFASQLQREGPRLFDQISRFNEEADVIVRGSGAVSRPESQPLIAQIQQSSNLIRSTLELSLPYRPHEISMKKQ